MGILKVPFLLYSKKRRIMNLRARANYFCPIISAGISPPLPPPCFLHHPAMPKKKQKTRMATECLNLFAFKESGCQLDKPERFLNALLHSAPSLCYITWLRARNANFYLAFLAWGRDADASRMGPICNGR